MSKFKNFIINEENDLKNLNIEKFLNNKTFEDRINTITRSVNFSKADNIKMDVEIPRVIREGEIQSIDRKSNPIKITLTDQSVIFLPYDKYKKIEGGIPSVGKRIKITLLRHPNDFSDQHSGVEKAQIMD